MQDYKYLRTAVTICATLCPKIWFVHFDPSDLEKSLLHHVSYTHDANLVTTGQKVADIMQI